MSASLPVALPDIGDFKDVPVVEILVKPGDRIAVDDLLISIESDKATMEVPSPVAGVVSEILVAPGTRVSQGMPILMVDTSGEAAAPAAMPEAAPAPEAAPPTAAASSPPRSPPRPTPTPRPPCAPMRGNSASRSRASPAPARRGASCARTCWPSSAARWRRLQPPPPPRFRPAAPPSAPASSGIGAGLPAWPQVDHGKFGPVRREALSRIQQISGQALARNWLTIPHVTNFDHADVTETEALRRELNGAARPGSHKVTMVAILIKAAAAALRAFPASTRPSTATA